MIELKKLHLMRKILFFLLPVMVAFSSCDDYGKKVAVGQSEVFYKGDGVTKENAEKLGEFLVKNKLFDKEQKSSAQITKDSNTYFVHLVMDAKTMDPSVKLNMWKLQADLSKDVFGGATARFAFTDDHLKDQEVLAPVGKVKEANTSVTFDSKDFSAQAMQSLAAFLLQKKLLTADKEADLFVRNENGAPVVRIIVQKEVIQPIETEVMPVFGYWQYLIQQQFPALQKSTFWLTTTAFEDYKKVPALTADEVAQIQNEQATEKAAVTETGEANTQETTAAPASQQP
jgi:hypothetical protein